MRSLIRKFATWFFLACILGVSLAVVGEWFIEVARGKGLYTNASQRWDYIMGFISEWATSGMVLYPITALGGIVAGLWVDAWAKRLDKTHPSRKDRKKNEREALSKELSKLAREIEKTIDDPDLGHLLFGLQSEVIIMMNKLAALGYFVPRPFPESTEGYLLKNLRMSSGYYRSVSPLIRENYHLAQTEGNNWGFSEDETGDNTHSA